ncbi:hypothetical protein BJY01DRAFT_255693 [Aspergillus pseudoustus]|uniref:Uncharacterized protein n=1 Tax=Aspergillus pseudoustus TaxID=1810923 RepID=A0ABR4IJR1_9EURO
MAFFRRIGSLKSSSRSATPPPDYKSAARCPTPPPAYKKETATSRTETEVSAEQLWALQQQPLPKSRKRDAFRKALKKWAKKTRSACVYVAMAFAFPFYVPIAFYYVFMHEMEIEEKLGLIFTLSVMGVRVLKLRFESEYDCESAEQSLNTTSSHRRELPLGVLRKCGEKFLATGSCIKETAEDVKEFFLFIYDCLCLLDRTSKVILLLYLLALLLPLLQYSLPGGEVDPTVIWLLSFVCFLYFISDIAFDSMLADLVRRDGH